jgi:hypothetical protein
MRTRSDGSKPVALGLHLRASLLDLALAVVVLVVAEFVAGAAAHDDVELGGSSRRARATGA